MHFASRSMIATMLRGPNCPLLKGPYVRVRILGNKDLAVLGAPE